MSLTKMLIKIIIINARSLAYKLINIFNCITKIKYYEYH